MCRGISFKVPNEWGTILNDILQGINCDDYIWAIDEDEVFGDEGDFLFKTDRLSGKMFNEMISSSSYYVVFLNLKAFPNNKNVSEINDYNDFVKSNCEIAMFVCDNVFVDVYVKNQQIIEIVYKNAIKHQFSGIQFITDSNDRRTVFQAN